MKGGATVQENRGRLLVSCPDQPGIVAAVSEFLFERGANIVHSDQHSTDPMGGRFFLRIEFELPGLTGTAAAFEAAFVPIVQRFAMRWKRYSRIR